MNDIARHQYVTGQINRLTADRTANASVFLFFPNAHFLKTILASPTSGIFGFARYTQANALQSQKSHFLPKHL
jgi:hypothetical protein